MPQYCASGCPDSWLGDRVCDRSCNTKECAYDAGDCGPDELRDNIPGFTLEPEMDPIVVQTHTSLTLSKDTDTYLPF